MIHLDCDGVIADWRLYMETHHFKDFTVAQFNAMDPCRRSTILQEVYRKDKDLFAKLPTIPKSVDLSTTSTAQANRGVFSPQRVKTIRIMTMRRSVRSNGCLTASLSRVRTSSSQRVPVRKHNTLTRTHC